MQLQTAQLIKRTAKANMERCDRPITDEEKKVGKKVTARMLLTYAALHIAVSDIKNEFDSCGLYRQQAKATINDIERIVVHLFGNLRRHIVDTNKAVARSYDNWNTEVCLAIDQAILLDAPERSVNIALACCRLLIADNDKLGRWCIGEAMPLHHIIRKLERLGIHDYHLDNIIERTIQPMI